MNKTSTLFWAIAIIILIGIAFFILKPQTNSSPASTAEALVATSTELSFNYVNDGTYQPKDYRVEEGQHVVIKVTSDLTDEVHFHGYDLHSDIENGSTSIEFTADKTDRFPIELENAKKELGFIEVYPK